MFALLGSKSHTTKHRSSFDNFIIFFCCGVKKSGTDLRPALILLVKTLLQDESLHLRILMEFRFTHKICILELLNINQTFHYSLLAIREKFKFSRRDFAASENLFIQTSNVLSQHCHVMHNYYKLIQDALRCASMSTWQWNRVKSIKKLNTKITRHISFCSRHEIIQLSPWKFEFYHNWSYFKTCAIVNKLFIDRKY